MNFSPAMQQALKPRLFMAKLLGVVFLLTLGVFGLVLFLTISGKEGAALDQDSFKQLLGVLTGVAVVIAAVAYQIPSFLLSEARIKAILAQPVPLDQVAALPQSDPMLTPLEQSLVLLLLPVVFIPYLLRLTLAEAVAIIGFVLSLLSENYTFYLIFVAVAVGLQVSAWPLPRATLKRGLALGV